MKNSREGRGMRGNRTCAENLLLQVACKAVVPNFGRVSDGLCVGARPA